MSQTEKLFGATSHSSVAEGHIVIGKDRLITVPKNLQRIAVQYDHNIETVTFDCPRFWDGLDMSKMAIYINYLCADRKTGTFPAVNVTPDKYYVDMMHFDWIISKNVSLAAGKIAFQVCVKKTDEDGNEVNHWNSEIYKDCFVSESLNCENGELNEVYPDLFAQWHREWMELIETGEFNGPPGVSPTITVTDIDGGHRITITDVNGTQSFDVMNMKIEADDAITELLSNIVKIDGDEPISGPSIWFVTSSTNPESAALKIKDENGVLRTLYPYTKINNVMGIDDLKALVNAIDSYFLSGVAKIANGGTGATTAASARTNLGITPENIGAALKTHFHSASDVNSGTLSGDRLPTIPITKGGTGATNASAARTNLGITPANIGAKISGAVEPISNGGTGASNGVDGLYNLLAAGGTILSSHQYGTTTSGQTPTNGRIFFKKVSS